MTSLDASARRLQPGDLISDRYRVERYVAEGGMGQIYKAIDLTLQTPVAVKLLHGDSAPLEERLRFHQEARALLAIQHPNVARVLGVDEIDADPCLIMEWLEGQTLAERLQTQRPGLHRAVDIALDIARALECAHAGGIVHRDVKPSNVMVPDAESGLEVKLLDFGIAHLHDTVLDDANKMLGTLLYMAPEQLGAIQARVDARADLYSLGTLMFELLTGQLPIARQSLFALMVAHQTRRPPLAHTIAPHIPPQLARIIGRLLALEPTERYPSARALIADLERWRREPDIPFELAQDKAALTLEDSAPLAGRDAHLSLLAPVWERTGLGVSTSVLVYGGEGVGKTRLVREAFGAAALRRQGRHFLNAAQYPASCAAPYQTLNTLFDALLMRGGAAAPGLARDAIAQRLRDEAGPLLPLLTHSLASAQALLGAHDPAEVNALLLGSERDRQIDVVARAMLALASPDDPIVFAFDDLQWANPTTLAVVARMLKLTPLGARHATTVAIWSGAEPPDDLRRAAQLCLDLHPLDRSASDRVAAGMLQTPNPPGALLDALWLRARGVPFLIEEQLRLAVLHGELLNDAGHGWRFTPSPQGDLQTSDADAARRARRALGLPEEARHLLAAAAILEHPATLQEILTVHSAAGREPIPPERLLDILRVVVDEERLLARVESRYAWRHRHIQQALLPTLSPDETQRLHAAALRCLATQDADPSRLAWHATQTGHPEDILRFVPPAALDAARSYANEDAERWLTLLLDTAPEHPDADAWRDALIGALYLLGRYDDAINHLDRALLRPHLTLGQRLSLLNKRADAAFGRGDLLRAGQELEAILDALGKPLPPPAPPAPPQPGAPPPGLAPLPPDDLLPPLDPLHRVELATCERLQLVYAFTQPIKLLPATLRMLEVASRFKNNRWRGQATLVMGFGLTRRGELRAASLYFQHARANFEAVGSPLDLAWIDYMSTRLLIAQGRLQEAFERVTLAAQTFQRYGEQWNRLTCATTGAVVAWLRADLEGLYRMVAKAREVMEHTRSSQHQRWVRRWELTLTLLANRGDAAALRQLRALADDTFAHKDLLAGIMTLERCAELHLDNHEHTLALLAAERATALMEQHQQTEPWLDFLYLNHLEAYLHLHPDASPEDPAVQRDLERLDATAARLPLFEPAPLDARALLAAHAEDHLLALRLHEEAALAYRQSGHLRRALRVEARRVRLLQRLNDPRWIAASRQLEQEHLRCGWPQRDALAQTPEPAPLRAAIPPSSAAQDDATVATPRHAASTQDDDLTVASTHPPTHPEALVQQAQRLASADRAILYRVSHDAPPEPVAWRGLPDAQLHGPALATGRLLAARVAQEGAPLLTTNFEHDDLEQTLSAVSADTLRSLLVLPVEPDTDGHPLVLYLDRPLTADPFPAETLTSIQHLTTQRSPRSGPAHPTPPRST